ncbi:MAG: FAD:protein FMN transferase [Desulfobacterales bacterium]|nr:FAD:protein FMN transferase [Desulfobacterales bacterium]
MLTDAWCTAIFVSGHEKGLELLKKCLETVMITVYSSGLKADAEKSF